MSKETQIPEKTRSLVYVVQRYGQIIAVYASLDDAEIICRDYALKGIPFVLTANFAQ